MKKHGSLSRKKSRRSSASKAKPTGTTSYRYTEDDLGEDILELSVVSLYHTAKRFAYRIYRRSNTDRLLLTP